MKKSLALMCALAMGLSGATFAAENDQQKYPEPKLNFGIFDNSTAVPRKEAKNEYSLSKSHRLCWFAFDMELQPKNEVYEILLTPDAANVQDTTGSVVSSEDKKLHTITSQIVAQNNEFVGKCWQFDKNDPLGDYKVDIRVNNVEFPTQYFKLVK